MKVKTIALILSLFTSSFAYADYQSQLDAQQRSMFQMQNQIASMQNQINFLQGQIDELKFQLSKNNIYVNTNTQSSSSKDTQVSTQAQAPSSPSVHDGLQKASSEASALYKEGYSYVTHNDYNKAVSTFKKFLDTYPNTTLTPNAWYWLGQIQYKQNNLSDARVSFLNVVRFEKSNKRPDSLYKLGLISKMQGDLDKAKKYFELVINTYPNDMAGNLARQELYK